MMTDMNATIQELNNTIQSQAAALQDLSAKDAAKTQQISDLNTLVNRTNHIESGLVDCNGHSDNWPGRDSTYEWNTTTISFSTPYDTPPVVHLGGLNEWMNSGVVYTKGVNLLFYGNYFSVTLTSVTNNNFTVKCEGYKDYFGNSYHSVRMSANWISLPDTSNL